VRRYDNPALSMSRSAELLEKVKLLAVLKRAHSHAESAAALQEEEEHRSGASFSGSSPGDLERGDVPSRFYEQAVVSRPFWEPEVRALSSTSSLSFQGEGWLINIEQVASSEVKEIKSEVTKELPSKFDPAFDPSLDVTSNFCPLLPNLYSLIGRATCRRQC